MKNKNTIGILLLALGIAIGWLAKPSSSSPAPPVVAAVPVAKAVATAKSTPLNESSVPGKRFQREVTVQSNIGGPFTTNPSELANTADISKFKIKQQHTKLEQRIAQLDETMHFTAAQKSRLTTWLGGQMKKMESMDSSNPASLDGLAEIANSLTTEALESQLAGDLASDQQTVLAEFKEKEFRREVDTSALKTLATLQKDIEFEGGQRDEIYKILTQNAEKNVLEKLKNPGTSDMLTANGGADRDPYDIRLPKPAEGSVKNLPKPGDTGNLNLEIDATVFVAFNKRVEEKIDELRPILNEKQLATYREKLESQKFSSIINSANPNQQIQFLPSN